MVFFCHWTGILRSVRVDPRRPRTPCKEMDDNTAKHVMLNTESKASCRVRSYRDQILRAMIDVEVTCVVQSYDVSSYEQAGDLTARACEMPAECSDRLGNRLLFPSVVGEEPSPIAFARCDCAAVTTQRLLEQVVGEHVVVVVHATEVVGC